MSIVNPFQMMVMDLVPFREVTKPGFLRLFNTAVPNFTVASHTYYRSMLEDAYDNIKSSLKEKLANDNPPSISVGLDGWSQFHHGYETALVIKYIFDILNLGHCQLD